MWGNYLCVRQTALWKKMTLCGDQGPTSRNWFKFLWSASPPSSTSMQPDIPAAPLLFSFFIHAQHHSLVPSSLFLLHSLCPYPAVHTSTLLLPVPCTTVSQPTSILALVSSSASAASHLCLDQYCSHSCSAACRAGCLLLGEGQKEGAKRAVPRSAEHHGSPTSHRLCFVGLGTEDKSYTGDL